MGGSKPDANTLGHFGVKGMHWGQRKAAVKAAQSTDHTRAVALKKKVKSTKVSSLTNSELQTVIARMNLEKQWATLNPKKSRIAAGQKFVKALLSTGKTINEAVAFSKTPAGQAMRASFVK